MKNYEKYAEEMKRLTGGELCNKIMQKEVLKPLGLICRSTNCYHCQILTTLWLLEEYEEPKKPEVDWSKVEVDTPILVRDYEDEKWVKKHFAKFENGKVYTWFNGGTSWSSSSTMDWRYAELAETEDEKWID